MVHPSGRGSGKHVDFRACIDNRLHDIVVSSVQRRHERRFTIRESLARQEEIVGEYPLNLTQVSHLGCVNQYIDFSHTSLPGSSDLGPRTSDVGASDARHRGTRTTSAFGNTRTSTAPRARPTSPSR